MRRLIVQEFATLDGLAAGPNGETGFIPEATEGDSGVAENQLRFIDTVDTIVLGGATYELFAGYWPTATGDDKPFADKLNALENRRRRSIVPRGAPMPMPQSAEPTPVRSPALVSERMDLVVWGSLCSSSHSREPGSSTNTSCGCCPSSWVADGRSSQRASARSR